MYFGFRGKDCMSIMYIDVFVFMLYVLVVSSWFDFWLGYCDVIFVFDSIIVFFGRFYI